jgi:hypothetical protein
VPAPQELLDDPRADVSGPAGDEDHAPSGRKFR